jgi:hypothetical protein
MLLCKGLRIRDTRRESSEKPFGRGRFGAVWAKQGEINNTCKPGLAPALRRNPTNETKTFASVSQEALNLIGGL